MESSKQIKLKITLLILILDRSKSPEDSRYYKLLLDKDEPIYLILDEVEKNQDYLKILNDKYLKYDHDFVKKHLVDFRILDDSLCEAVYLSSINYTPGLNKDGTIYSYDELEQRKIQLDGYYERAIARSGSRTY